MRVIKSQSENDHIPCSRYSAERWTCCVPSGHLSSGSCLLPILQKSKLRPGKVKPAGITSKEMMESGFLCNPHPKPLRLSWAGGSLGTAKPDATIVHFPEGGVRPQGNRLPNLTRREIEWGGGRHGPETLIPHTILRMEKAGDRAGLRTGGRTGALSQALPSGSSPLPLAQCRALHLCPDILPQVLLGAACWGPGRGRPPAKRVRELWPHLRPVWEGSWPQGGRGRRGALCFQAENLCPHCTLQRGAGVCGKGPAS